MRRFRLLLWLLPITLISGCASTPPPTAATPTPATKAAVASSPVPDHTIIGTGTADDRAAIHTSNQQILNTEHAMSGTHSTTPVQNGGIP